MKTNKKTGAAKKGGLLLALLTILFLPSILKADGIVSLSMNPTNPAWGQQFVVNISYCGDQYNAGNLDAAISTNSTPQIPNTAGQVFLISNLGIDIHSVNPNQSGGNIGYNIPPPSPFVPNCAECSGGTGELESVQYTLTMPNAADMGSAACGSSITNLNFIAGFENNIMNWSSTMPACDFQVLSWIVPVPAQSVTVQKNVEGTLALVGDLVLYSVDYTYSNGAATISDPIPGGGCLALVDCGPNPAPTGGSVSGAVVGETSGTVSWTMPNTTYTKSGTVWMLLQMTCAIASGTVISNTVTGTNGSATSTSTTNLTVGTVGLTLSKAQSVNTFLKLPGSTVTITYFLNYQINGDVLKAIRMFDDDPNGAYNASPPPGWQFLPQNGTNGTWTISDSCNTGDRIITASVPAASQYPDLLLDDPANESSVQMCDSGIIESDVMINPGNYPGADGLVIIRSNGQTGNLGYAYSLLLSIDTNPAGGYVGMMECGGGTCTWPAYVDPTNLVITGNTWYRVKIVVSNNGFTFNIKVWQVGQPEPTAYQLVWTAPAADQSNPNWECPDMGGTNTDWRPGIGEQGNDVDSSTQDSYNNFILYNERTSANTVLYDTVPTGLTYSGSNPAGSMDGSMLTWNMGNISDQSGSYTWWASTSACNQSFTNIGGISGTQAGGPAAAYSNPVVFNVNCISPTSTVTQTPTPNFTISKTASKTTNITKADQLTFSIVVCNNSGAVTQNFTVYDDWSSGSADEWQYQNPYYTSPVGNGIYSLTANLGTPSTGWTQFIFVPTPTGFTGCFTFQMFLGGAQSNYTCGWHNNASLAFNGMPSPVSTVFLSDFCSTLTPTTTPTVNIGLLTTSPTQTPSFTSTMSWTSTPVVSASPTFTPTMSWTVTPTDTNTIVFMTQTATGTFVSLPTLTASATCLCLTNTVTPTYTATPIPQVSSLQNLTVSPPAIYPGQNVTITFQFKNTNTGCTTSYFAALSNQCALQNAGASGQVILVSEAGMDVLNNSVNGGRASQCAGDGTYHSSTETACGMETGGAPIYMTVPSTWTPGTYYAIVAVRSCNVYADPSLMIDSQACVPFTVVPALTQTPANSATITPTYTNTPIVPAAPMSLTVTSSVACAALNGLVVYTISFTNVSSAQINNYSVWDTIPAQLQVASITNGYTTGSIIYADFSGIPAGTGGSVTWSGWVTSQGLISNTAMDSTGAVSSVIIAQCTPVPTMTMTATITVIATNTATPTASPATTGTPTQTPTLAIEPTQPTDEMPCEKMMIYQNIIYPEEGEYLKLHYSLYESMKITIKVYNRNGILVKTVADDMENGDVDITWDGRNDDGNIVSSGIYLLYIKLGNCERKEKVAIIR